jgi:hypothetical protein
MAGAYLGVCSLTSALTKNQVISFVISLLACAVLVFLGYSGFTGFLEGFLPVGVADAGLQLQLHHPLRPLGAGIVDPKDVVFFLSLIGLHALPQRRRARALTGPTHETRKQDPRHLLLLVGLVLVNYLASSLPLRLDATAERIYTLSPGTRALLGKIGSRSPSTSTSRSNDGGQFVEYKNYAERVREMLRQYVRASTGKVTLNVIDPEPDTPRRRRRRPPASSPRRCPTAAASSSTSAWSPPRPTSRRRSPPSRPSASSSSSTTSPS